jgi:hypothetical protein
MIRRVLRYLGQAVVLAIGAAIVAYFSIQPSYEAFPADRAQIKLSFAHVGKPKGECRRLTREELAALPPNMRRPTKCPRERVPLRIELEVDGALLFADTIEATGLAKDLPAHVYEKLEISPGAHRVVARLRDSARAEGFDYVREAEITLVAREILVVDFMADRGGFLFL